MTNTLYHYTGALGLKGILESKTIFMSDYRFLNDSTEFKIGWDLIRDEVENRRDELDAAALGSWQILIDGFQSGRYENSFGLVGCLSTEGDLLSQWRGYNGGKGYCIGFNKQHLKDCAKKQGFLLTPVMYSDHDALAKAVVNSLIPALADLNGDHDRILPLIEQWWVKALKVVFVFKDKSFREEQENRLISISSGPPTELSFRSNDAGVIPYIPFHLDGASMRANASGGKNFGIERIIVGPALKSQQIHAIKALLGSHNIIVPVEKSVIPYVAD